jgi:localization factor PodJL
MPSSGRSERSSDRSKKRKLAAGKAAAGEDAAPRACAAEPAKDRGASEDWDAQSVEALTKHYESGEAYPERRPEKARPRLWQPPHGEPTAAAPSSAPPAEGNAWLEAHLSDMARRLQASLAELDPDKSLSSLNHRLDVIEQRLGEALADVAQRSDLGALRLIEANVLELAQHMEQTRGRLDRLDGVDEQLRDVARRMEEGDRQRLAALERLVQDHFAEWRRSDERTASALGTLEEAVNRVGEQVEAVEANKPAPSLSLYALATPEPGGAAPGRDPLSQAYADAALALEQQSQRSSLDAADYAPRAEPSQDDWLRPSRQAPAAATEPPPLPEHAQATGEPLPSPAVRASVVRAQLRQAQLLDVAQSQDEAEPVRATHRAAKKEGALPFSWWRNRAGLLLSVALVMFGAGGYLTVDALMTPHAHRTADVERGAHPGAEEPASDVPLGRVDRAPEGGAAAVDPVGDAMRITFRPKTPSALPAPEPAAIPRKDAPASDAPAATATTSLPMTIGPASLRQAAMRGEASAQFEIAARFAAGMGVPRDLPEAVRWYGRAAAQGMALAQYRLGMLHERGWGTAPDPERARVWYGRAAEQGNVKAMHNLAVLSVSGGRSDYATAAKWFAKAADLGLADSQFNLAALHQTGVGVPKDLRLAYQWLTLAARGGDREAATGLAAVRARLSPADLQEAEALVAAWRPRTPDPAVNESASLSMAP